MSDSVDERLLSKLERKLGLSRSQVNRRIAARARELFLPRAQAAIALASEHGINLTRIVSTDDLAAVRGAVRSNGSPASGSTPEPTSRSTTTSRSATSRARSTPKRARKDPSNSVFVVHGRNERLRSEIFSLLRNLGVHPLEWNQAIELAESASPYVGQIIDAGFKKAAAIVVLLTPDDEAQLKAEFRKNGDPAYERRLTGQPRLNVVFEAGRAFGTHPNATVLVQVGKLRPFSDISGRHVVHLSNTAVSRQEFATKLENAGCRVDRSGTDWLSKGDFSLG